MLLIIATLQNRIGFGSLPDQNHFIPETFVIFLMGQVDVKFVGQRVNAF